MHSISKLRRAIASRPAAQSTLAWLATMAAVAAAVVLALVTAESKPPATPPPAADTLADRSVVASSLIGGPLAVNLPGAPGDLPAGPASPTASPTSTDTAQASPTALPPTATITPTQDPWSLWVPIAPGVEERVIIMAAQGPSVESTAVVLRIDTAQAAVSMHYNREAPARVGVWDDRLSSLAALQVVRGPESGPYAVINAGYFQSNFTTAGLIVSEGRRFGDSFGPTPGHAEGMFSLVGGRPSIRSLATLPYDPAEPLDEAVQGLPMLIDNGAAASFAIPDHAAKRTAIALDGQGRLLLINVANSVTLLRLQGWLLEQKDLGIVTALNLDGGSSSGMVIPGGPVPINHDSGKVVPAVMAVTSRP